ncbi:RrF2 family transcriptional regulator [Corynebacterium oculi]|uniref:HTH-type transcriptional regulator IscR n=1 Tax=Corynebacterium oculi TaxID=1544416 RepID=A0A0Q0YE43_9CORY|nr:Rrf2 family transcriptional regulator [Corynebacterium oculi]KQB84615.1 HTH-type transcriptional regulator IscR [Corynebacterium oculi]
MKINRSTEQAVFVVMMMALQKGHTPLPSATMSTILGVSDSYLKKVLRMLVEAELITAIPGREGGYSLRRSVETLSLGDVMGAMESVEPPAGASTLAERLFDSSEHMEHSLALFYRTFDRAAEAFNDALSSLPLTDLLEEEAYAEGTVDWAEHPLILERNKP